MLKQCVKTTLNLFEHVHYPIFLSNSSVLFSSSSSVVTSFQGLLLSLTLMQKSKKTLETCLDFMPSFKTSVDARVEGLFNVHYL